VGDTALGLSMLTCFVDEKLHKNVFDAILKRALCHFSSIEDKTAHKGMRVET
jgi:hypothetical protein